MRIINNLNKLRTKNLAIALGVFDGLHLGHRKILQKTIEYAKKHDLHSAVLTFDPHPQFVVNPKTHLKLITTIDERMDIACKLGIEMFLTLHFTSATKKLSAEKFIKKFLVDELGAKVVVVGYDFGFGGKRKGGIYELKTLGRKYGFKIVVIPPVKYRGHIVKSSLIRDLLQERDFNLGLKMLMHPYILQGKVVSGHGRGAKLGFKTANLAIDEHKLIPSFGVYAAWAYVGAKKYMAAVNIGSRPTFGVGGKEIEVHILDFDKNIRGKQLKIEINKKMREERKFESAAKLIDQIRVDLERVRVNLSK